MIQPLLSKVLIRPFPSDEETQGGILVPMTARERNNKATIVSVGNGTKKRPMGYKAGDVIHHIKDCGTELIENGDKLFIIDDVDILAFA